MKKLITICLVCVCVLSTVNTVLADDIFPPSWRGEPGTVTAQWDSWSGFSGPMYPDYWTSNPQLPYPPNSYAYSGTSLLPTFNGRTNVIELTGDYQIDFWMPNFYKLNPYKEVQIQVTYYAVTGAQYSSVDVWAAQGIVTDPVFTNEYSYGDGWFTDLWTVEIWPNPSSEVINVNFTDVLGGPPLYPAYLDQVVIDTYCVPEPATICLLGLGALSLLRRKK